MIENISSSKGKLTKNQEENHNYGDDPVHKADQKA
jgi:hypothetical protein